ncbi:MAG: NAD-dependent deacylase [Lautropia sp.]
MPDPAHSALADITAALAPTRRIAVLTGAGMSAESGIPTFRGARNGLWERFEPERLATPDAFEEDNALVWGWYRWRTALVELAQPHAGHLALVALEKRGKEVAVITQNVDDLHERAGSADVVHLHGSLFAARCSDCSLAHAHEPAPSGIDSELRVAPPRCRQCGAPIRPGVVWFGEQLPALPWARAEQVLNDCDLLLVVGTSGVVFPAADLPHLVKRRGKPVLEINPVASAITPIADLHWPVSAATGLAQVLAAVAGSAGSTMPEPQRDDRL